jgi:hypothetical protein
MNEDIGHDEIKVWHFARAPKPLHRLAAGASEWVALIPASLVSPEVEAIFLRWESETHPVIRRKLGNGSILLAGSYPTAATMSGSGDIQSIPEPERLSSETRLRSSRVGRS